MSIDYRNVNMLWASVLVETLQRLGLQTVVICPGSRSGPLAIAFAEHPAIESIPILDERSASFFALGQAQRQGRAVVIVCTSGTAGANMYPAVIEAAESRVPLLVLTADRPPELRDCGAGQAIDQQKLYGTMVRWYAELALPDPGEERLRYLRQMMVHAWDRAHALGKGPVHLNLPFREPLVPLAASSEHTLLPSDFFAAVAPPAPASASVPLPPELLLPQGIIIAGVARPPDPQRYCQAIAHLSKQTGFPVLAEGLSPVRNWASLQPYLVTTYDSLLRSPTWARSLVPQVVVQLGPLPTSKVLRQWLSQIDVPRWVVDPAIANLDPTHGRTRHLRCAVTRLAVPESMRHYGAMEYARRWCEAERLTRQYLDQALVAAPNGSESRVTWLLSQHLPPQTPLVIANSTPVRDVEWFWPPGDREIAPYVNRGANGIDGTLSTAVGVAHGNRPSVLLTGDLALLHDSNGFLLRPSLRGHLTIVLVNNGGGGIFELLPVAQFDPPFTEFFVTPQAVDIALLCQSYGVSYRRITDWDDLAQAIAWDVTASEAELPSTGMRLLEVQCDRKASARWRQGLFERLAQPEMP
ncbi:MAG: 2-succinyl-5-enolpyruvyl-6-hydroxy-3-cyclohexene-1-carboxylic-acid synthase [Elainellaceae cyanobacterium]